MPLLAPALVLLSVATVAGLPSHYNSCTANLTGGTRLQLPFCDSTLSIDDRIHDLVSRMTYEEKCAALDTNQPSIPRLGVPALQGGESTHGVASGCVPATANSTGCPTSFPTGPGLGASFDRTLWIEIGNVIGREARALNNAGKSGVYFLDPNINLCRDPRWGRCQEVPGEDPVLTAAYAVHLVNGTQFGEDVRYIQAAATVKHFSMYDMEGYIPRVDPQPHPPSGYCDTSGGCERWNFDMVPPQRDFLGYYLKPFEEVITKSRPESIMCSYNAAYGIPTCANDDINNGLVRKKWGFKGFFVSDCTALELMQDVKWDDCQHPYPSEGGHCTPDPFPGGHNYTRTTGATVHAALVQGGIDYNCGSLYKTNLYNNLVNGAVQKADVDVAVSRLYRTMFRLGFFDPMENQTYVTYGPTLVDSADSRHVALTAARESIVLLRNTDGVLPIAKTATLAFIGPHANSTQSLLGNYHGQNTLVNSNSPLQAAEAAGLQVTYAPGCQICDYPYGENPGFPNMPCPVGHDLNKSGFSEAVSAAKNADVAIVFVGLDQTSEAENFDRWSLTLPGVQEELIAAILAVQKRVVVVLVHGGGVSSTLLHDTAPAVLTAFYPGELGGPAIVDVLTGAYNPAGKLPYTIYPKEFITRDIRTTDLAAEGGVTYQWYRGQPLWPFGYGLSYTTFVYNYTAATRRALKLVYDASELSGGAIEQSVIVTNTGSAAGDCVVLGFVTSNETDVPRKKLFDFDRLPNMMPGESRRARLTATAEALSTVDDSGNAVLRHGRYRFEVGDTISPVMHAFTIQL
eukprot:m.683376 g.683376  ORF g.683376 m.683376 type:complete len:798 (-) comp22829_c0_seq1:1822-4215(-)